MKDLNEHGKAKVFEIVINKYSSTMPQIQNKLELIIEIMASKEMYLARYYVQRENGYLRLIDLKML